MKDIEFLKKLTDAPAGSGDEGLVRKILKEEIEKVTVSHVDAMGNIYGEIGSGPSVLAVGHMDEIGFMVRNILPNGLIKVGNVGFVFSSGITSQLYTIQTKSGNIDGVIALNPNQGQGGMHNEYPSVEELSLDIGCKSKEEVLSLGVEVGNSVIAKSHFTVLQNRQLLAKAWDNRIGCAVSVKVLQNLNSALRVKFIGGGTVQEEVGCRGARALGIHLKPSIAFSLDTSPASDEEGSIVGAGPQLFVMDSATIGHKKLLEFVKRISKENQIPYQLCLLRRGGTDAGEFQNISGGVPSLAIGIAVKYIHTPTSVISYADYEYAVLLLTKVVEALNEDTIREIYSFD